MRDIVRNQAAPIRNNQRPRRKRRRNLSLYYLLIFIVVIVVGVTLSLTVFFNISEIIVVGDTQYDNNQIISSSKIKQGDNLIITNFKNAESSILKDLIYIDSAEIKRSFPDKVIINVTASVEYANVKSEDGYLVISRNEKILNVSPTPHEDLIIIEGADPAVTQKGETFTSKDSFKDVLLKDIFQKLIDNNFDNITKLDISDNYNPVLVFDDRINIELGTQTELDYKIRYAKELVNAKISKKVRGTLFLRDSRTNEASFIEEQDLERYKEGYNTTVTTISSDESGSVTEISSTTGQPVQTTTSE